MSCAPMPDAEPNHLDPRHAALRRLARRRANVVRALSGLLLASYFALMATFAFDKPALAGAIRPGLTLWLALGPGFIVAACLLSLGYVTWANHVFDATAAKLAGRSILEPGSTHDR